MNILGLVFSLLLILSYAFYACSDKQKGSTRLRTTYIGHETVHRKILNSYQSEVYKNMGRSGQSSSIPIPELEAEEELPDEAEEKATPAKPKKPDLNHECAKLDLWPLAQEGRENHLALYELAAKLIRTFYAPLNVKEKNFEYHFLDALLTAIKTHPQGAPFAFEKLELPGYQPLYYKMLRGTKEWDLAAQIGYPPLLDYIKASSSKEKVCLFHAHPDVLTYLFGPKVAAALYPAIHQQGTALTKELVEKHFSDARLLSPDPELLSLLHFGHTDHPEFRKALTAQDNHVSLRQTVYLEKGK